MAPDINHQRKPHAIMIAVPFQGHINPFVNLALKLASYNFTITFAHLQHVHHALSKAYSTNTTSEQVVDMFSQARQSGLDIRYTTISDGLPLDFDRDLHIDEYMEIIWRDFPAIMDEFVGKVVGCDDDRFFAYFLVADNFYAWSAAIAEKYDIVDVSFWTQPALVFTLNYRMDLLREKGHFPCHDNIDEEINYIPGIESISTMDFMPYLKESGSAITQKAFVMSFEEVKKADFILHNTVEELEPDILSALNKYQPNYAIGPIGFSENLATVTVSKSLRSESDCTHWLKSKSPGSVLYVSFGSVAHNGTLVNMEEIAYGLLLSEVNFIWVVPACTDSSGDSNVLPKGFEDVIKNRGLIIPWCNQVKILSDPAVGGFMTHCGWNSILESIWCGTPMICYPVNYDQPVNRKLVVDDWKVGINVCDGKSIDRKEVAEKIKRLMSGSVSSRLRQDIVKVGAKLKRAVGIDGSSERNFDRFIEDLKVKIN